MWPGRAHIPQPLSWKSMVHTVSFTHVWAWMRNYKSLLDMALTMVVSHSKLKEEHVNQCRCYTFPTFPTQCATTVSCKLTPYMHVHYRIIIFMLFDYTCSSLWQESHNHIGGQLGIKAEGGYTNQAPWVATIMHFASGFINFCKGRNPLVGVEMPTHTFELQV